MLADERPEDGGLAVMPSDARRGEIDVGGPTRRS